MACTASSPSVGDHRNGDVRGGRIVPIDFRLALFGMDVVFRCSFFSLGGVSLPLAASWLPAPPAGRDGEEDDGGSDGGGVWSTAWVDGGAGGHSSFLVSML